MLFPASLLDWYKINQFNNKQLQDNKNTHAHTHNLLQLSGLCPEQSGWLVPEGTFCHLLDFLVQNEDNIGRWTNNPDGLPTHPD